MTPTTFGADWWTPPRPGGGLWLGLGLLLAPLILGAVGALIGFVVGGSNLREAQEVQAVTLGLALTTLAAFALLSATTGLAAALTLWATRRRSILAFAAAGAVAGAIFGGLAPLATGEDATPEALGFMALGGALHLLLTRWIAGVRQGKGDGIRADDDDDHDDEADADKPAGIEPNPPQ